MFPPRPRAGDAEPLERSRCSSAWTMASTREATSAADGPVSRRIASCCSYRWRSSVRAWRSCVTASPTALAIATFVGGHHFLHPLRNNRRHLRSLRPFSLGSLSPGHLGYAASNFRFDCRLRLVFDCPFMAASCAA